jgi:hypothetical protein
MDGCDVNELWSWPPVTGYAIKTINETKYMREKNHCLWTRNRLTMNLFSRRHGLSTPWAEEWRELKLG